MGLSPFEVANVRVKDIALMDKALYQNNKHDFNVMRHNAFLVSAYSGLSGKQRQKLSPTRMFPFAGEASPSKKLSREQVLQVLERSNQRRGVC